MRILITILTFINLTFSYGQSILIPGQGIQGDAIKINEATILEILKRYGDNFEKAEKDLLITYKYEKLGISFSTYPYDSNQLLREISVEFPFKAQMNNGVILNRTTWKELEATYGFKGGFTGSGTSVCIPFTGGAYYLHKDRNKKGWNENDTIFKIEINNKQSNGFSEKPNYVYNITIEKESIKNTHQFIHNNPSLNRLEDYFTHPKHSFDPRLRRINTRTIEDKISQTEIEIAIGTSTYHLNILSTGDTLFYVQTKLKDSIVSNYRNEHLLTQFINRHNTLYQTRIDTTNENSFISNKFVYGFSCGFVGTEPPKRIELDYLIRTKDYQTISAWLRSVNPEIQAYGLEGIYTLSKSGIRPTSKDIEIMEYLVHKTLNIYACSGCIYGIDKHYADIVSIRRIKQMKKHRQ